LDTKIIKLRAVWNELILNKTKRELYFDTQFKIQYDVKFLKFLLIKSIEIINIINNLLPMTQLDELMANDFKNLNWILFKSNHEIEYELEDGVRFDLFLDNLKLHQIHLQIPNQENENPKKKPILINSNINVTNTKYLRKIFRVLLQWENSLNNERSDIISQYTEPESQLVRIYFFNYTFFYKSKIFLYLKTENYSS
jgi:hypothetical protein